jgi:hypothetical protein
MDPRPRWSGRRRRTLAGLAGGTAVLTLGAVVLPDEFGVTSGFLAALCGFLLLAALVVFVAVPGPDTLGTLLRTVPLAGAVLVVAVLLLLSATADLRPLWWAGVAGAAGWLGFALWQARAPEE